MKQFAFSAAMLVAAIPAIASEGEYMPPVTHPATKTECSACHMAYPAGFLPARSWIRIMTTLDDHFGENAMLDDQTRSEIEDYLIRNSTDSAGRKSGLLRGVQEWDAPLRITEMPWFRAEHDGEVSARRLKKAGSMSNCAACHRGADRGVFED